MKRTTERLSERTWLKTGGTAEIATPETKSELVELLTECHRNEKPYRILGNGSNLLVSDDKIDDLVIDNTEACTEIEITGTKVVVGASVMVPQFITTCINNELGGYEYLYSVPGTMGGAIYMNAGRGRKHDMTIADHLESVEYFADGEVHEVTPEQFGFRHRYSAFQDNDDWVILSATFDLPEQSKEVARQLAKERMAKVRERERSKPNAGSVFKSGAGLPLHRVPPKGLSVGSARFISSNRICHDGSASFEDIKRLVTIAKWLNYLTPPFKKPEVEWEIWS